MSTLTEPAPAKVNLTLQVKGRRADGYHELASLVAFADAAASDTLTLAPGPAAAVTVTGPFSPSLAGENLVAVALARAASVDPGLAVGAVTLDKRLPIAAGIGGGSADAAAVLRLLRRANPDRAASVDWLALALRLGADVPVCLASRATFMTGIGERLMPVPPLPPLHAVLVNPLVAVPADKTAQVFRALGARALPDGYEPPPPPAPFAGPDDLVAYMDANPNDLHAAARAVVPVIDDVTAALAATARCRMVRLSGGGPTCFGIYDHAHDADAAAMALTRSAPSWWIRSTILS